MQKSMKSLTFKGGIHPAYHKEESLKGGCKDVFLPGALIIPLSQHIGAPNEPLVKKGDVVEEGQVLGKSASFVSSPIHSPVSGKVTDIKKAFHPTLGPVMSVFIERDPNKPARIYTAAENTDKLSAKDILEKIKSAGIVGMGGASFPTHVKLSVPEGKKITTLIINGVECEPYLTCDESLMGTKREEILKGISLLAKILNPENIVIAIEDNKKEIISSFEKEIKNNTGNFNRVRVATLKTKYPQGGEKQLIQAVSEKEVPPGKLPFDIGFLVQNVGTVYAVYEAVYLNKPLIERVVTFSGDALEKCGNYRMKIGTTVKEAMELGGIKLTREPKKIIIGGPMMGTSQPHMDIPVLKNTCGVLFLSEKETGDYEESRCIKCARCFDVCPVRVMPMDIMKNVKKAYWSKMQELCVTDCMECGACSYICPARIPLVHYIKEGKAALAAKR